VAFLRIRLAQLPINKHLSRHLYVKILTESTAITKPMFI